MLANRRRLRTFFHSSSFATCATPDGISKNWFQCYTPLVPFFCYTAGQRLFEPPLLFLLTLFGTTEDQQNKNKRRRRLADRPVSAECEKVIKFISPE